jgi:MSHA biogenesis protein MshQ
MRTDGPAFLVPVEERVFLSMIKHTNMLANKLANFLVVLVLVFSGVPDAAAAIVKTRVTGAQSWSAPATWIQLGTGTARFFNNSTTVTGTGTAFQTELQVGDVLMLDASPGTVRGTVASIASNTSLQLVANASGNANGAFGRQAVPTAADDVQIGNTNVSAFALVLSMNVATATVKSLRFVSIGVSQSLSHPGSNSLTVTGAVTVGQPSSNNLFALWAIDGGSATVGGDITIGGTNNTATRIARIRTTGGTLTTAGNLTFTTGTSAAVAEINMTGGGTLKLAGALIGTSGTLAAGTNSTVNFNGSAAQTIRLGVSSIVYNNIVTNNTSLAGATLSTAVSSTNVTGHLTVQSGILNNGGFAIVGGGSKAFQVDDGATLNLTGVNPMATGYSSKTFKATSTVNYAGAAQTVSNETYGHLTLSGTGVKTMPAATLTIIGNFTMSGTGSATLLQNALVGGNLSVTNGTLDLSTFTANRTSSGGALTVSDGATLRIRGINGLPGNYASRSFGATSTVDYNGVAQPVSAETYGHLSLTGSGVKTMPAGAVTMNGNFTMGGTASATAASSVTVNGNFTLGVNTGFNAGPHSHSVKGNFTNSGTFTPSTSTFTFNGAGPQTITGVTSFYDMAVSASSALTTASALTFNRNLSIGTGTSFNAGALSHSIQGNLTNSGTLIPSTSTFTFNAPGSQVITGDTTFNNLVTSGTVTLTAAGSMTINSDLTLGPNTTFVAGANNFHNIGGNFTNNGSLTASGSTFVFQGSSAQTFTASSNTVFDKLTISNAAGLTLSGATSSVTVGNLLSFTSGRITTGANQVIFGTAAVHSGASTTSYVAGAVTKSYSATGTMLFPVGNANAYAPVVITGTSGFSAGSLTISTTGAEHPSIGSSLLDSTRSVNRYWSLVGSGLPAGSTYDATFNFVNGSQIDIDSGATPASFVVKRFAGATWHDTTGGSATCTPSATNRCNKITGELGFGEFAIGEAGGAGLTCYNDGFNRANGAPGVDWTVGSQGGTYTPAITANRLRLTDSTAQASTFSTLQRTFPGAGNKVIVTFQHFAYGGNGAIGMAVVLSDASIAPAAGAFGGSLGYAQKLQSQGADTTLPGFAGGWIGVGIDEYGSFSATSEGRNGGVGTVPTPQSVAVRGSGSGYTGYNFLKGATVSPEIDGNGSASPPHQYRIIVDHSNQINAWTSVERDIGDGNGFLFLVQPFDAKAQPGQAPVPPYWNLSFTGATGPFNNIHEIDGLQICSNLLQTISLHHIELHHRGTVCGAETVTVKACANESCSALYGGAVTVDLANLPNSTWSSDPVTFSGGQATVTLSRSVNGAVTLGATATSPVATNPTLCNNGTLTSSGACTLTFVSACLDAVETQAISPSPIFTKLAGKPFSLDVLALNSNGTTINTAYAGAVSVDLVDSNNTVGGNCSNTSPGLTSATLYTFAAGNQGRKSFTFDYGQAARNVRVRMITAGEPVCSKDNFAIRPQQFALATATPLNPLINTQPAGADFNVTANAGVAGGYTGTPAFDVTKVFDHSATALTIGSLAGIFTTGTGTAASGTFRYNDVGTITFNTNAVADTVFTAVDQVTGVAGGMNHTATGDCIGGSTSNDVSSGRYGCNIGSPGSPTIALGPLGRFRPDHYEVTASLAAACNGFTYMGQSALGITLALHAMSSTGVQLSRYSASGGYGNLCSPQSCLATFSVIGDNAGTALAPLSNWLKPPGLTLPAFTWTSGAYTASGSTYNFSRLAAPEGPYDNFALKLTMSDPDGVSITRFNALTVAPASSVTSATTQLRYGRLLIDNSFGSQKLNLPVNLTAQHWDSSESRYVTNTADNGCTITTGNLGLSYIAGSSLTAANIGLGHIQNTGSLLNGKATITLAKPAPTISTKGSVDLVSASALTPYLPGSGRETFGVFKGGPIIYMRERY